jgi:hypothetical protein
LQQYAGKHFSHWWVSSLLLFFFIQTFLLFPLKRSFSTAKIQHAILPANEFEVKQQAGEYSDFDCSWMIFAGSVLLKESPSWGMVRPVTYHTRKLVAEGEGRGCGPKKNLTKGV